MSAPPPREISRSAQPAVPASAPLRMREGAGGKESAFHIAYINIKITTQA